MDPNTLNIIKGAAGAGVGGDPVYVEEVFSTDVYSNPAGAPNPRTVTNGINFLEEGGLLWVKNRSLETGGSGINHVLFSTANSATSSTSTHALKSNTTDDFEDFSHDGTITWKTDGWSVSGTAGQVNGGYFGDYAAWSFRKAPGFFDVVTWSGNSTVGREIPHNLGSVPGMIIVKCTTHTENWVVWHRSILNTQALWLQSVDDVYNQSEGPINIWNSTTPTSTAFTVGDFDGTNGDANHSYVAYVFAHDDQQFGEDGDESIIKCGTYSGNVANQIIDCGFEPQWVLVKKTSDSMGWFLFDTMRGMSGSTDGTAYVYPNSNSSEDIYNYVQAVPNGFQLPVHGAGPNDTGTYIYMAIRRGPMKTPEDATEVFDAVAYQGTSVAHDVPISPSYADLVFYKRRDTTDNWGWTSRLTGNFAYLNSNDDAREANRAAADALEYDKQSAFGLVGNSSGEVNLFPKNYISYVFKRAPGFFDVVCYDGSYPAASPNTREQSHNLGVAPELILVKKRAGTQDDNWHVYSFPTGNTGRLELDNDDAFLADNGDWYNTTPTPSVFTLRYNHGVNANGQTYIAYLFASLDGISKVGSETTDGISDVEVTCEGFTSGARFVMLKRTDAAGDWYVYDSTRGISPGNDEFLLINDTDVEDQNDYIDPLTTGFKINSSLPAGTYIYLAIA